MITPELFVNVSQRISQEWHQSLHLVSWVDHWNKTITLRYSRIVYFMNTLGAKDFSSAVSGFCQAFPGYFMNGHEVEKSTQLY